MAIRASAPRNVYEEWGEPADRPAALADEGVERGDGAEVGDGDDGRRGALASDTMEVEEEVNGGCRYQKEGDERAVLGG